MNSMSLQDARVLVTATSYARDDPGLWKALKNDVGEVVVNPFARPLTSEEVAVLLPGCQGYIAGLDVIDREALATADSLRVIARYGAGVDRIDLDAARKKGIIVTNTPGANAISVAELAIALMLSVARRIPEADRVTKAGGWSRLQGLALEGRTVGLIGLGAIGKAVARRLQAFDCRILAYDPYVDAAYALADDITLLPLDDLLPQSDIVSLHVPALPVTRGMVNADFLARMKPGAILINTARGELVDEAALLISLTSGHLRGAGLDAFAVEPPGEDNPLFALPQIVVTPHTGAHTDSATNAMGWGALRNLLAALRGENPPNRVA
jgi:D-3-phosphoglycerate dehydrogenase